MSAARTVVGFLVMVVATALAGAGCDGVEPGEAGNSLEVVRPDADDMETLPRMVELYTPFCPACRAMKPTLDRVVSQCDRDRVRLEVVDVSAEGNEGLLDHYRVRAVPTFLFLDEYGVEVARLVGVQTEDSLKQALSALRGEECPGMSLVGGDGDVKTGG